MKTRSKARPLVMLVASAGMLAGCAKYEYFVERPETFAGVVPEKSVRNIQLEPLQYGLWEHGDRLAMRIDNPTTNLVTIQEGRSYILGPEGRSHTLPLKNAPIAPGGHVAMVLPPQVPMATPAAYMGPSFSLGFGFGRGYWGRHRYYGYDPFFHPSFGFYTPMYYQPAYYVDDVPLWQWKQGMVSLRLTYQSEDGTAFTHDLVFDRRKVRK